MKKHFQELDKKLAVYAAAITCILAYVLPCRQISEWQKEFGYPFGWFTVYHDYIGDTIMSSTAANLSHFIINTVIWYTVLRYVRKLRDRRTNRGKEQ